MANPVSGRQRRDLAVRRKATEARDRAAPRHTRGVPLPDIDLIPIPESRVAAPAVPSRLTRRQRAALAVLLTASFTLAVELSVLNVALPTIGADVGFALIELQWMATAFALCAAGFTLFFGRIADLFGRRRLFLIGMAALGISSLVGGPRQFRRYSSPPASFRVSPPRLSPLPPCRC